MSDLGLVVLTITVAIRSHPDRQLWELLKLIPFDFCMKPLPLPSKTCRHDNSSWSGLTSIFLPPLRPILTRSVYPLVLLSKKPRFHKVNRLNFDHHHVWGEVQHHFISNNSSTFNYKAYSSIHDSMYVCGMLDCNWKRSTPQIVFRPQTHFTLVSQKKPANQFLN